MRRLWVGCVQEVNRKETPVINTLRILLFSLLATLLHAGVATPSASACGGYTDDRPARIRIEEAAFHHFDNPSEGISVSDIRLLSAETAPTVTVAVGMWVRDARGRRSRTERRLTLVNRPWAFVAEAESTVRRARDPLRFAVWQHLRDSQRHARAPFFALRDVNLEHTPTVRATATLVVRPAGAFETRAALSFVPSVLGWTVSPS